ncbi:MAG: DNA-directed RNA polymerase subunit beta' [Gemmatimonadota bacterium]|nr:DNA-directed RNA polymerase subunit beta' [Gemmatimonadota bacterium]MDE2863638.1 DNA-directed RNA polymerase subunit beta' [Gemmatimonadota bacterium]MYB06032.1 DNA-directed RNA polymerase subunit beta' [Gemmatimonadota bacterium]MYE17918.1 DNA-directed RNA polymerase subunit beta' [Gemmatimonadota bacterium]MYG21090.1 DNA-directed RNA polymerase subunit beta' [Gemmatimonadota bacterium]
MIDFPRPKEARSSDFDFIRIRIASSEDVREWSYGEVTKPETINYRSFKPEPSGLFCQRIFGPVKDWECACGKYKRIRFRGIVCDRCGVEVTLSKVRRERIGHIEMAVPVSHIWFLKTLPSQLGYLLGMTLKDLEQVIYYAAYVVTNPGNQDVEFLDLLDEDEYYDLRVKARAEEDGNFKAEIGAEAARTLLKRLDSPEIPIAEQNRDGKGLDRLAAWLRHEIATETSQHRKKRKLRRLKVVDALRNSGDTPDKRNKPEWMVLDVIPVIPPDLRPLVPLDGGRFATSDLNDLYRRVINRNNRLKKLIEMRAPEVILRNEKRMLQESVDALFDNGRRSKAIRGRGKRPLKSLSDMLKGKQGRFRLNLLGKRVDYSGRSVIVVGPELKLHQCGLPKAMAVELFKPFIIHELEKRGEAETVKRAKKIVEQDDPKVYEVLEDIIRDHPVLLNRAPTLHRIGIQAFEPVLVEGKAIRIHPLVCTAFNADFDGDQMAVHLPLSYEAQLEARVLMLSSNNVLLPSNGRPVAAPSQDMVIGCYYLTKPPIEIAQLEPVASSTKVPEAQRAEAESRLDTLYGDARRFSSYGEVEMALAHGHVEFSTPCHFWVSPAGGGIEGGPSARPEWVRTTVGRVLFNSIIPESIGFLNRTFGKKQLGDLVFRCFTDAGLAATTQFLDHLKDFGFRYATLGGVSVGVDDLEVPPEKAQLLEDATQEVTRFQNAYASGFISNGERYNKIIDTWTHANNDVADAMVQHLERSKGGFNPVYMMMTSGARGNRDQMRQLAGMRGLMAKPQKKLTGGIGEIIESPIRSNFREGLSVVEYFISTHGARKGLADTALKTADAGYLTRRLVDVAQDVTIAEDDCGTFQGIPMSALKEGEDIVEPLADRIVGNVALESVYDPIDGELILTANELISEEAAEAIEDAGIQSVKIRSVLTCETKRGICRMCYGRNLATMQPVDIGEAVGIIAAQSIGEPGTQLTLRTFHIGGTAARIAAQNQRKSKISGIVALDRVTTVTNRNDKRIVTSREGKIVMQTREGQVRSKLAVPYGAEIHVDEGMRIRAGDLLFSWDPYSEPIVGDSEGYLRFVDIVEEQTVREELDESTGRRQMMVIEDRDKKLHPTIQIRAGEAPSSELVKEFIIPVGAQLLCSHGDEVRPGDRIARISREVYKTRDITGGLPRVAELFEARSPKDPAIITEIDGTVSFGDIKRGKREVFVAPKSGQRRKYDVPVGKHMRVHQGDQVRAGDRLSEGPINPHDILKIKGPRAVQKYLLNEIQEVYRLQGVTINDKHIGVIVRQMLQKVRVVDPGETHLLEGDHVDRVEFRQINELAQAEGKKPAIYEPLLLGITKASLTTDSFISAASFQETTRVLTDAAVRGARDDLKGLKENIIIGHLIPAGTGAHRWHDIEFQVERDYYDEEILPLTDPGEFLPGLGAEVEEVPAE